MNAPLALPLPGTKLPHLGGNLGAYVAHADGSVRALIVSPATHERAGTWGEYGQDVPGARSIDGLASTNAMAEAGSELARAVRALTIGGCALWYIPSRLEWLALQTQAPQLFKKTGWYWSSTQYSRLSAYCQDFEYGYSNAHGKDTPRRARAVRSVQLQDLIPSALPAGSSPSATRAKKSKAQAGEAA